MKIKVFPSEYGFICTEGESLSYIDIMAKAHVTISLFDSTKNQDLSFVCTNRKVAARVLANIRADLRHPENSGNNTWYSYICKSDFALLVTVIDTNYKRRPYHICKVRRRWDVSSEIVPF